MDNDLELLNPQIKEAVIGIRKLRKIKIYPLSIADQSKLTNNISSAIFEVQSVRDEDNIKILSVIKDTISDNIGKIMTFISDENEEVLTDITNDQLLDIIEIVFEANYASLEKKTKDLLKKLAKVFLPAQLSPVSLDTIPNTDLKMSSVSPIEKEDLQ
jgi:hypothetical protein